MASYVVRVIGSRQLVGVFVASSMESLADMVDECTDVPTCEYRRLPGDGGIYFDGKTPVVPFVIDEGGYPTIEGDMPFSETKDASVTETKWEDVFMDEDPTRGWKRDWGTEYLTKEQFDEVREKLRGADGSIHMPAVEDDAATRLMAQFGRRPPLRAVSKAHDNSTGKPGYGRKPKD
jgi:hypothetical protein